MPWVRSLVRKQILHATWTVWPKKKKSALKGLQTFSDSLSCCDLWTFKAESGPWFHVLGESVSGGVPGPSEPYSPKMSRMAPLSPRRHGSHLEISKIFRCPGPSQGFWWNGSGGGRCWTWGLKSPMGIGMCNSLKTGLNNRGGKRRSKETFSSEWAPAKDLAHILWMLGPWV